MNDLKKRFIVDDDLEKQKTESYVERLLPFCKVTKNGNIILDDKVTTSLDKVKTALVGRFLANKIEPSIPAEVTAEELSKNLDIPKDQIYARLKDLKKAKVAVNSQKGGYEAKPLEIGKVLDELEKKYGESKK
jgi:hypothetical protein